MTSLVPLGPPPRDQGAAGSSKPHPLKRRPAWIGTVAVFITIWVGLQLFPKAHPLVLLHSRGDYERILRQLSDGPDHAGSQVDPSSDRGLFAAWLLEPEGTTGLLLTVGGAIDYEQRQARAQRAAFAEEMRRREAYAKAQAAQTEREQQAIAERTRAENEVLERERAASQAQASVAAAAQAKTVACNTARAHAYATAASPAAFIAWVKAHPCPEGTDIGDGYWNVAR